MNSIKNILIAGFAVCAMGVTTTSCSDDDAGQQLTAAIMASAIEFDLPESVQQLIYTDEVGASVLPLIKGEKITLGYSLYPEDVTFNDVTWTSSNPTYVACDANGNVEAVQGGGYSVVTVAPYGYSEASSVRQSLKVMVSETLVKATGISVSLSADEVYAGETVQATAAILPEDATYRTVRWSSSDESIATVDMNGVVTGQPSSSVKATATITATALDGSGVTASATVTVKQIVQPQDVTIDAVFEGYECAIAAKTLALTYATVPEDCTKSLIEWTSSDEEIATVSDGVVTFNQTGNFGEVTITATCPETGKQSSVKLNLAAGLIRELYKDPDNITWKDAGQSGNGTSTSTEWHDGYVTITTYAANATAQRADIKSVTPAWLHAGNYPIFAIKMDDVKDLYGASRNINFDVVGTGMVNGTEYKAIGNGNNKYSSNFLCSDGSRVFVYDLSTVACGTGGLLPTDQAVQFRTFQLKYADMKTLDHQVTYNIYWVQTFKTLDDVKAYITAEGLTFE